MPANFNPILTNFNCVPAILNCELSKSKRKEICFIYRVCAIIFIAVAIIFCEVATVFCEIETVFCEVAMVLFHRSLLKVTNNSRGYDSDFAWSLFVCCLWENA